MMHDAGVNSEGVSSVAGDDKYVPVCFVFMVFSNVIAQRTVTVV